ncbi:hypothetical protein, partial [Bacillus licheniformis]|uniref:hypothetical protein n=1 Tax=Bacillus licheniformis TaxID=1402 RepID=UPI001EE66F97
TSFRPFLLWLPFSAFLTPSIPYSTRVFWCSNCPSLPYKKQVKISENFTHCGQIVGNKMNNLCYNKITNTKKGRGKNEH